MNLLEDIQCAVLSEEKEIGPILLKLRLLAARLGSAPLEEWVRHESDGYPNSALLPDYRVIGVAYSGTFSGPFGSGIQNAPIPSYLVEKFAGKKWTNYELRQSISAVDDLVKSSASRGGTLEINAANLILLLQGNVYENYACNSVTGSISRASLVELQHAVRSRILELTIGLERSVAGSTEIAFGSRSADPPAINSERVTQITNQVVYGNVTSIASSGEAANFNVAIQQGDQASFVDSLVGAGISETDATALATIVASEGPESRDEPLGAKAKAWLLDNLKKAANGTWKVGVSVATQVLKEAALRFYGLK